MLLAYQRLVRIRLTAPLGDQKWSALIDDHFQTIADIVKEHRGQFVKSLGDGTLSCFSSANQALIAAVEMQNAAASATEEPRLGLRIGIHTGNVVQSRGDFFGSVVNKAARITAKAAAGEILVSDTTRAMVGATRTGPRRQQSHDLSPASAASAFRAGLAPARQSRHCLASPKMDWPLAGCAPRRSLRPARQPYRPGLHATTTRPDASEARPPRPDGHRRHAGRHQTAQLPAELR